MRPSTKEDISKIIVKIGAGNFNRGDVKLLLYELREYVNKKSILRDLGDFIHPVKNKGYEHTAYTRIKSHVSNFIKFVENSGKLNPVGVYSRTELIDELIETLRTMGFVFNTTTFKKHKGQIIRFIMEFLNGTKIDLIDERVLECLLTIESPTERNDLVFTFKFTKELNGLLHIPANSPIGMPFFID